MRTDTVLFLDQLYAMVCPVVMGNGQQAPRGVVVLGAKVKLSWELLAETLGR